MVLIAKNKTLISSTYQKIRDGMCFMGVGQGIRRLRRSLRFLISDKQMK
jgi:hypothetical protein